MVMVNLLLLVISRMLVVLWEKGFGLPERHVQVLFLMSIRIQGTQRRGDGKDCAPLPPMEREVRWASLAIFFLALGLGEVCTGDAWNVLLEARGSGWSAQPKGPVHRHWSILFSCMRVRVWTNMRVLHFVPTTTTTTTTTAPQGAVTVGFVAAPGPLLSTPSFADSMADSVDDRAVPILLQLALKKKKEEEDEEERRRVEEEKHEKRTQLLNQKVGHDMPLTKAEWAAWRQWVVKLPSPSSSAGTKRKRKKRKRKLPKSSSSVCRRPCAHQRQVPAVQEVRVHGAPDSVHRRRLDTLVVQQRQVRGFLVQKTVVAPQLQFIAGRQHPLRAANADPHGPVCSADHGDSTVAAYFGGRCSCCRVVQILRCCRGEALGAPTVAARREIWDFLRPLVSDSHLFGVRVCLWRTRVRIFREMTPGMVSVLNTPRFDSGYIFGVSLRSILEEFPSYFSAMLGSTVDTSFCVRLRRLVFLVTMQLALFSFVVLRPQMLVITAGMDQKECYVWPC